MNWPWSGSEPEDESTDTAYCVTVEETETRECRINEVAVTFCGGRQTTIPYRKETISPNSVVYHHPHNGDRTVVTENVEEFQYNQNVEMIEVDASYQVDHRLQDVSPNNFGCITHLDKSNALSLLVEWVESNSTIRGFGRRVSEDMFEYVTPYGDVRYVLGEDELVFTNEDLRTEIVDE